MKANFLPLLLFDTLYEAVLTFESEGTIVKCHHSNERSLAVFSCDAG